MIGLDELTRRFAALDSVELARWIENRWILPDEESGRWLFHEVDVARVELILEIRREFAVDDEAIARAWREVAAEEGFLLCPEGAATYAAYKAALADGRVGAGERAVLFNCATGLKYPMPEAGRPLKLGQPVDWTKMARA